MGTDPRLLRDQCARTLTRTDFAGLGTREEGKVRDNYVSGDRRTIVVTDRITLLRRRGRHAAVQGPGAEPARGVLVREDARDRAEPPDLGARPVRLGGARVHAAAGRVRDARLPHRLDEDLDPDRLRARRAPLLRARAARGLRAHEPLPAPLLTPTTKAPKGEHDELVSREEIIASGTLPAETYDAAERLCQALFAEGQRWAASRGLILVDTKYEIAQRADGTLVVIDEIHTPDSSRYWYRDRYERALAEGRTPEALDKEYVRRWLGEKGYKGDGPPPELPVDVRCEASRRYIEAFEQITGRDFEPDTEDPRRRIARNLGIALASSILRIA